MKKAFMKFIRIWIDKPTTNEEWQVQFILKFFVIMGILALLGIYGCGEEEKKETPKVLSRWDSLSIKSKATETANEKIINRFKRDYKECLIDSINFDYTYQYQNYLITGYCLLTETRISDLKQNVKGYTIVMYSFRKIFVLDLTDELADRIKPILNQPSRDGIVGIVRPTSVKKSLLNILSASTDDEEDNTSYMTTSVDGSDNPFIIEGTLTDFEVLE